MYLNSLSSLCVAIIAAFAAPAHAATSTAGPPERIAAQPSTRADATVLLLQDEQPWSFFSNEQVLASLGVAYDVAGSADLAGLHFAKYSTIIVASVQSQAFYDALAPYAARVGQWLSSGPRTLEFHGATYSFGGFWTFALPQGVTGFVRRANTNFVIDPTNPLVAGVPRTLRGNYASQTALNLGSVDPSRVSIDTVDGLPTLVDYCHGAGRVIVTGVSIEWGYDRGLNFAQLLPNLIAASTTQPGCPG